MLNLGKWTPSMMNPSAMARTVYEQFKPVNYRLSSALQIGCRWLNSIKSVERLKLDGLSDVLNMLDNVSS